MTDNKPVKYSIIITSPSPDIDPKGKEQFHLSAAVKDLSHLDPFTVGSVRSDYVDFVLLPYRILEFMKNSINSGALRVEIVEGGVSYKLYVKGTEIERSPEIPDSPSTSMLTNINLIA